MGMRLIRSTNSEEVTAYDDAVIFHSAKGHDYQGIYRGGIFEKVYKGFSAYLDITKNKLIIQSGMGMLYGRQFELKENETIEISYANLSGYITVYLELTITKNSDGSEKESISIKHTWNSSKWPSLGNTDLITNRYGTATMELYRITVGVGLKVAPILIDRRYIYKPGYAEKARMMDGNGIINGRKVDNLIFNDKDQVKHTDHAYYTDRANSLGSTGVATTRNAIDDNLYMKNRDAYLITTQLFPLKTDDSIWEKNSKHEVILSIPSGYVIGAILHGSAVMNDDLYVVGNPTSFPFTISKPVTNDETVVVTVYSNKATIELGNATMSGQLYLALLMIGSK